MSAPDNVEEVMGSEPVRRAILLTPRDWELIALREAEALGACPGASAKRAEAKRYGLIAAELERLQDATLAPSNALQAAYRSMAFMRPAALDLSACTPAPSQNQRLSG